MNNSSGLESKPEKWLGRRYQLSIFRCFAAKTEVVIFSLIYYPLLALSAVLVPIVIDSNSLFLSQKHMDMDIRKSPSLVVEPPKVAADLEKQEEEDLAKHELANGEMTQRRLVVAAPHALEEGKPVASKTSDTTTCHPSVDVFQPVSMNTLSGATTRSSVDWVSDVVVNCNAPASSRFQSVSDWQASRFVPEPRSSPKTKEAISFTATNKENKTNGSPLFPYQPFKRIKTVNHCNSDEHSPDA